MAPVSLFSIISTLPYLAIHWSSHFVLNINSKNRMQWKFLTFGNERKWPKLFTLRRAAHKPIWLVSFANSTRLNSNLMIFQVDSIVWIWQTDSTRLYMSISRVCINLAQSNFASHSSRLKSTRKANRVVSVTWNINTLIHNGE